MVAAFNILESLKPMSEVEMLKAGRVVEPFRVKAAQIPKGKTYYVGEKLIHAGDRIARGAVISTKPKAPLQKLAETVAPKLPPENRKSMPGRVTKADLKANGITPKDEITIGQGEQVPPQTDITKDTPSVVSATQAMSEAKKRIHEMLGDDDDMPRQGFNDDAWDKADDKPRNLDESDPWAGVDLDDDKPKDDFDSDDERSRRAAEIRRRNAALLGDDDDEAPEASEDDFKRARTVNLAEERQRRIDEQRQRNAAAEETARNAKARVEKIVRIDGDARQQLKRFVSRIEAHEKERKEIAAEIKAIMTEAKAQGFDTKILRKLIAIRKIDADTREEEGAMLDIYMSSIGMLDERDSG